MRTRHGLLATVLAVSTLARALDMVARGVVPVKVDIIEEQ